jgi:hypothetical protein
LRSKGVGAAFAAILLTWICGFSEAVPGDPIFRSPYRVINDLTSEEGAQSFAVGDLNADNAPDLVLIGSHAGIAPAMRVYLGDGYGNFSPPLVSNALYSRSPRGAVLADLNRDGNLDMAVCASDTSVHVLLGHGDGTFGSPIATGAGNVVRCLSVGDMNEDQIPDLVAGQEFGGFSILLGDGTGHFAVHRNLGWGPSTQVVLSDINGDGHLDVLGTQTTSYLGDGAGGILAEQWTGSGGSRGVTAVADLDGDGRKDVLSIGDDGQIRFRYAGAAGLFERGWTEPYGVVRSMVAADFDRDGHPEFVIGGRELRIYATNPAGRIDLRQTLPSPVSDGSMPAIQLADLDGDGRKDIVAAWSSVIAVYLGGPNGTFPVGQPYVLSRRPGACVSGDFWGVGRSSVATILSGADSVAVLSATPDGTMLADSGARVGHGPSAIASTDMDGDGLPDLLIANALDATITVLRGSANHGWERTDWPAVTGMQWLATADMDADGGKDIVTGDGVSLYVIRAQAGTFELPVAVAPGAGVAASFGDLDGDGDPDLALANGGTRVEFFQGGPGVSLEGKLTYFGSNSSNSAIRAIDTDHDARTEFLFAGSNGCNLIRPTSDPWWYRMIGPWGSPVAPASSDVATADLDADGKTDFVAASSQLPMASVHLCGPPTAPDLFPQAQWIYGFGSTRLEHVLLADVTGDALVDLVVTDPDVDGIWLAPHAPQASTAVEGPERPDIHALVAFAGSSPNPMSGAARIRFRLETSGAVRLTIVDVKGCVVRRFPDRTVPAGDIDTAWDGNDERSVRVKSGVYYVRLETRSKFASGKVVVL